MKDSPEPTAVKLEVTPEQYHALLRIGDYLDMNMMGVEDARIEVDSIMGSGTFDRMCGIEMELVVSLSPRG